MQRDWNPLALARSLRDWMRRRSPSWHEVDWSLVVLLVGFVLVAPIGGLVAGVRSPLLWAYRFFADPSVRYERAIATAAVKRPDYKRTLATIDQDVVRVVTFRRLRELPPPADRTFEIWVSLGEQLRAACAGAANPVPRIQRVLGLPPGPAPDHVVTELEVARKDLVRPCVAGHDVKTPTCEFKFPDPPAPGADAATLRGEYDQLRLVAKQMWNSYRVGFDRDTQLPADERRAGYPFTGMGWSYDWGSGRPGNFGVTEFVIKPRADVKVINDKKPADFCGK